MHQTDEWLTEIAQSKLLMQKGKTKAMCWLPCLQPAAKRAVIQALILILLQAAKTQSS
jgi:hypothetical protein